MITFNVDMSAQVLAGTFVPGAEVDVRGTFNGWGTNQLTNITVGGNTNLYAAMVADTVDVNGGTISYKYFAPSIGSNNGWESTSDTQNRAARLPAASGAGAVLPTAFFDDAGPLATNAITFSVNLAEPVNLGLFVPGTDTVSVRGNLNGFALGSVLTNDPSILTTNRSGVVTSNVYVGTFMSVSPVNADQGYKFWNSDPESAQWETVAPENQEADGNRYYINGSGDQVLPLVDFSDTPFQSGASNTIILDVSGQANIWGAGHTGLPSGTGGGIEPPMVRFEAGSNQVLVFASVSGLIDIGVTPGGYVFGQHGPDGDADSPYGDFYSAVDGISGYVDSNRVAMLVGVFLDDTEPANPATGSLDFSDGGMIGHIFSSLAPQLGQVFFIGDGLAGTGTGSQQIFRVPPTATRLCLGIPDVHYDDNSGSFVAVFTISPPGQTPAPSIQSVGFMTNGTMQLQLSGLAGESYLVQASTNLLDWVPLGTNMPVATPFYLADPAATNVPVRFYRVMQQ
ncbi:MAG TPA: hypothetical protein VG077_15325 [Verrucomicrobiae bacterium]|nr:hypothetical protein [Verrucomicrobiae bacterium]